MQSDPISSLSESPSSEGNEEIRDDGTEEENWSVPKWWIRFHFSPERDREKCKFSSLTHPRFPSLLMIANAVRDVKRLAYKAGCAKLLLGGNPYTAAILSSLSSNKVRRHTLSTFPLLI
jgi:hypothetical protein